MSLEVVYLSPQALTPYEGNTRKHNPEDIEQIKESILADGFNDPIGIWGEKNLIVEGHGRQIAAMELGLESVPCIRLDHLTDTQRRDYAIRHNRTAELSGWDFGKLEEEIARLEIEGVDLSGLKFDLDALNGDSPEIDIVEDEPPEPPETPIAKRGDIWQLGRHRLMCGDSTDPAVIDRLMDGVKADMVFTDPPYNMSADFSTSTVLTADLQKRLENIVDFEPETISWIKETGVCSFYIFTSKNLIPKYFEIFKGYDFNILVWCKDNPSPMTNYTFLPDIEYLLYFSKKGKVWNNGLPTECYKKYYNGNKLEGRKEAGNVHPTIKPLKIIADKIQISSNKDGVVLDLFGGSGSTLIACEQLNRSCYMMELDPHYCDVIIQRWENLTGEKAVLLNA